MRIPGFLVLAAASLLVPASAEAPRPKVVASFSILGDIARIVGGDQIDLVVLVGPGKDAHTFEPNAESVRSVAAADVLIVNGLGFERWLDRLVSTSGFGGETIIASADVEPRYLCVGDCKPGQAQRSEPDPHAWQDPKNGAAYAQAIADGLSRADPAHSAAYQSNAAAYIRQLLSLDARLVADFQSLPTSARKIITSHDAFDYLGAAYGLTFLAPAGLSTEAEASAADIARIITLVRDEGITAIFVEASVDPRLIERIAQETGIAVGGALYSDALSPANGPVPSYIDLVAWNANQILKALSTN